MDEGTAADPLPGPVCANKMQSFIEEKLAVTPVAANSEQLSAFAPELENAIKDLEEKHKQLCDRETELMKSIDNIYEKDDLKKHGYRLHAVAIHQGQASAGHYWAYVRKDDCPTSSFLTNDIREQVENENAALESEIERYRCTQNEDAKGNTEVYENPRDDIEKEFSALPPPIGNEDELLSGTPLERVISSFYDETDNVVGSERSRALRCLPDFWYTMGFRAPAKTMRFAIVRALLNAESDSSKAVEMNIRMLKMVRAVTHLYARLYTEIGNVQGPVFREHADYIIPSYIIRGINIIPVLRRDKDKSVLNAMNKRFDTRNRLVCSKAQGREIISHV
ncbi:hypothetical protein TELCIR_03468 [Teladorsagia circumcincta]|uniref:Peptidase C19 ubiquitin carboxyl-terminal hydrolase domain-containing protein n=1 Tax=Teladorsagia circumcincta TaxID=45464 RepID=A0A2G9UWI9_TELCI|nr:hypothetical protein TELCIR_03468 [Teladorsagia circumcincta]